MARLALTLSTLSLLLLATSSQAALAPNSQRAKELNAVLEAATATLPQRPISKVIYQKEDQYKVIAGPCSLKATIVTIPMKDGMVGPRQFEVKLGRWNCR